jgi:hypothetical protein
MITNTGKNILAKYLIGQAPAYASYIAFGCGPKALSPSSSFDDYSKKESLDFEMFRSPIISRGYVSDSTEAIITNVTSSSGFLTYTANNQFSPGDIVDIAGTNVSAFNIQNAVISSATSTQFSVASSATGSYASGGIATRYVSNIVFTAQLPTEERYEITEVGVFSAGSNPSAGVNDSKTLYAFTQGENWEYHPEGSSQSIKTYTQPLYQNEDGSIPDDEPEDSINVPDKVFQTNADNAVFDSQIRVGRSERSRFLNNTILLRGDTSTVLGSDDEIYVDPENLTHIHLNGVKIGLDKNSPQDEMRVALSLINKDNDSSIPSDVKVIIEFSTADSPGTSEVQYARFKIHLKATPDNFNANRYFVISKKLEELEKSTEFSWAAVSAVKVYSSVIADGEPSENFYVALDAVRIENTSIKNPLYGLVGYTVLKTPDGSPIIKNSNSTILMEFRFAVEVL